MPAIPKQESRRAAVHASNHNNKNYNNSLDDALHTPLVLLPSVPSVPSRRWSAIHVLDHVWCELAKSSHS